MLKKRVIAVIIIRDGRVVQSVQFKHTNVIHYDAYHAVEAFNQWAVDEIVLLNVSYDVSTQNQFVEIVEHVSKTCFVPLAVGGWINSEKYAETIIESGADKLVLNSIIKDNPELLVKLSQRYGQQCIVGSMDVKRKSNGEMHIVTDRGRKYNKESPGAWASYMEGLGVGEILFNSVDHDGNRKGYDLDSLASVIKNVNIPVIAFGGVMFWKHMAEGLGVGADAVAAANIFHYKEHATKQAKKFLAEKGYAIRIEGQVNYEVL
ncbi:MAG: imidazole glycerol phosphate synthase subunit HisF [Bacteroidetes bacterium]|nr:imidazole glycerol phosphate synthase subunit HisF [Bacteroidota bacterium]